MTAQPLGSAGLVHGWLALPLIIATATLPLDAARPAAPLPPEGLAVLAVMAAAAVATPSAPAGIVSLTLAAHAGAWFVLREAGTVAGHAGPGLWSCLLAAWLLAWCLVAKLAAASPGAGRLGGALGSMAPLVFGAWVLILWQAAVTALKVPFVLLPPPSAILLRLDSELLALATDFRETFLKAALAGWAIGSGAGFLTALVADRVPFLGRGLLPLGNFVSALPIVAIAPIMVMWFGFDWPSKAAVVVVMTFFPMLVNTVAGLAAAQPVSRDLMRSYGASWMQSFVKLRLPQALPFVFNALKINAALALTGAMVAEFFGTPTAGLGFRIATEAARMNIDFVGAAIAVAAVTGSAFYGVITLLERPCTFWRHAGDVEITQRRPLARTAGLVTRRCRRAAAVTNVVTDAAAMR